MHNFVKLIFDFMKLFSHFIIAVTALFSLVGCNGLFTSEEVKIGAPYSVVVVCDNKVWLGELGKELQNILEEPINMVKENEKSFDIIHISPEEFTDAYEQHRNILKVVCSPSEKECVLTARRDVHSSPQAILTLRGNSEKEMTSYIKKNGKHLLNALEATERERTLTAAKKSGSAATTHAIKELFGIDMLVPAGYNVRNKEENFLWASNEYPKASQGFFIYTHPFEPKDSLSVRALVRARNKAARLIPGPADGSFMTTVTAIPDVENNRYVEFLPTREVVEINGRYWVEMRGFWEVDGDYMGGPFVSYTTLDERSNKLITLDCYLYAPAEKKGQRKLLRWLEHLVYGVTIPTEE